MNGKINQTKTVGAAPAESAAYLLNAVLDWLLEGRSELLTPGDADPVETAAMKLGKDYMLVHGLDIREVDVVEGVVL